MQNVKELREKRAKLVADAQEILKIEAPSPEDTAKFDALMDESDKLKAEIDRHERADTAAIELAARRQVRAGRENRRASDDELAAEAKLEMDAFMSYCRVGLQLMPDELRPIAMRRFGPIVGQQATTPGTAGGYTVPQEFVDRLETAMLAYGGMRTAAEIMATASGAPMPYPTANDTNVEGEIIAENAQHNQGDVLFGQVLLNSFTYSSKMVKISLQLLQDSAFDMNAWLPARLGERLGRITNRHYTVGSGTGQPMGIVTAATLGKAGGTGETTSITYADLVDLEHSIDPAYRNGARWMFHDTTLRNLKKLVDGYQRPLWLPGIAVKEPDTLLGYGYIINQHMPVMAANAKSIVFGALSKYLIRDVLGVQVLRLTERFADFLQVAFLGFLRSDGNLIDAGTRPVKYYQNSATFVAADEAQGNGPEPRKSK